jgi:hypothetical protein
MTKLSVVWLMCGLAACSAHAAPPPPEPDDVYGWKLPRPIHIDTIDFPARLIKNRSYGRVVAEISLHRDGTQQKLEFTLIENGDLTRWAEKILTGVQFTPALLDGSPQVCRVPAHVVFLEGSDYHSPRYEIWLPGDSGNHAHSLAAHFLAINRSLPPVLLRAGAYAMNPDTSSGLVAFQVYVLKDGSREEGRVVHSGGDERTREALSALVDMRILPPRFNKLSYGCWVRIMLGYYAGMVFPTRPIDLSVAAYEGWPAPVLAPVGARLGVAPQFQSISGDEYDRGVLNEAADIAFGHALFYAHVDTLGRVTEWFKARPPEAEMIGVDHEYAVFRSPRASASTSASLGSLTLLELAWLASAELEKVIPRFQFSPARNNTGAASDEWVLITPATLN